MNFLLKVLAFERTSISQKRSKRQLYFYNLKLPKLLVKCEYVTGILYENDAMKRPKRQSLVCIIIFGCFLCGFILQLLNRLNCFWDAENLVYDKEVTFTDEELFNKVERLRGCSMTWKDVKGINGLWGKINSPGESLKNIW